MCQWSKNLCKWPQGLPFDDAERPDDKIIARMVPKFHLAAHHQECRANFSLNYNQYVLSCLSILTSNSPGGGNSINSLHSMARMTSQQTLSNNERSSVASLQSFVNFSNSTSQNLVPFLPLLTMMLLKFLCSFRPPSHSTPAPSVPQS